MKTSTSIVSTGINSFNLYPLKKPPVSFFYLKNLILCDRLIYVFSTVFKNHFLLMEAY